MDPKLDQNETSDPQEPRGPWRLVLVTGLCALLFFSEHWLAFDLSLAAKIETTADARISTDGEVNEHLSLRRYGVVGCNRTEEAEISVATGYFDAITNDWVSRGWTLIKKDDCIKLLDNREPPIYVFVADLDRYRKPTGLPTALLCVDQFEPFEFYHHQCLNKRGDVRYTVLPFQELPVSGEGGEVVWDITP